eukprot:TRINITY_DN3404_c0_g1_i1.p1 TRINITY_DN3404_c0_g1~~TRINITY_DN3404_c0_g1_i1.p1  ORF type:complete len:568 (+),score=65.79 TRINITY_DN3404_c0_g1_i1:116-1819(+)
MIVIAYILKGRSWEEYSEQKSFGKQRPMSRPVWQLAEAAVYAKISTIFSGYIKSVLDEYRKQGEELSLVLCGDGAWAKRTNSSNGIYTLFDAQTGKLVYQYTMSKGFSRDVFDQSKQAVPSNREKTTVSIGESNYEGTSKGMEGYGFRKCMDALVENKLLNQVKKYVCDQDSSVLSQLNEPRTSHIQVYHDIGHAKKNLKNDLAGILGKSKELEPFAGKIAKWFLTSMMASRTSCEALSLPLEEKLGVLKQEFHRRMAFWKSHYTQETCLKDCPCENKKAKIWIDLSKPIKPPKNPNSTRIKKSNAQKVQEIEQAINKLNANISRFAHFWSTCLVESCNALRAKLIDKDKAVLQYYREKTELSAMIWNEGKEEVFRMIYKSFNLKLTPALENYLQKRSHKHKMDVIRMSSLKYKKRDKEINTKKTKQAGKEKEVSKKYRDNYKSKSKKSTLDSLPSNPSSSTPTAPAKSSAQADVTNIQSAGVDSTNQKKRKRSEEEDDFSVLGVGNVDALVGKRLAAAMTFFNLRESVNGSKKVGEQRSRLKQVLSDPNARENYPGYFTTAKKART